MNEQPPVRYKWPWIVLMFLVLGLVLVCVWMWFAVQRVRQYRPVSLSDERTSSLLALSQDAVKRH